MGWICDRYVSFDHCCAVLPCFKFARRNDPHSRLRKLAAELEMAKNRRRPSRAIAFIAYLPVNLRQVGIALRKYGKTTRRSYGQGYLKQFGGLLYFSWRLNQPPHDYYLQKIWLQNDRKKWTGYLQQREHVLLVKHLRRSLPLDDFDDKLQLFFRLRAADLPTIPILRAAAKGRWLPDFTTKPEDPAWKQSLVTKPTDGSLYDGVSIWHFDAASARYRRDIFEKKGGPEILIGHEVMDLAGLMEKVRMASLERTFLIQPFMENHPSLTPLSPHGIANFRVVTVQTGGSVRVIAAALRMGYDNLKFTPGTYLAEVNLETGILGLATGREEQWHLGETHLETGEQITGRKIENWEELKALAIRGHSQFPWMPSIGWDVISTKTGAMIMEANAFWGVDIVQSSGRFLGEAGYAEAYLEAYEREMNDGAPKKQTDNRDLRV